MKTIIKIKRLRENAKIPSYATEGSAGADLASAADEPIVIPAGGRALIPTGIAAEASCQDSSCGADCGAALMIYARSGLASKYGIALANGVGVVDSDYRGEILVSLVNLSDKEYAVSPGERIAQLVVTPVIRAVFKEADNLDGTDRGAGGFGSTGKA